MARSRRIPRIFIEPKIALGSSTDARSLKQHLVFMPALGPNRNPRADHRRHALHCALSCTRPAGDYRYDLARSEKDCDESGRDGHSLISMLFLSFRCQALAYLVGRWLIVRDCIAPRTPLLFLDQVCLRLLLRMSRSHQSRRMVLMLNNRPSLA